MISQYMCTYNEVEHGLWAAGELVLELNKAGFDKIDGVSEGGRTSLCQRADVIPFGGPHGPAKKPQLNH